MPSNHKALQSTVRQEEVLHGPEPLNVETLLKDGANLGQLPFNHLSPVQVIYLPRLK